MRGFMASCVVIVCGIYGLIVLVTPFAEYFANLFNV
jgi:hypothetical protein